MKASTAAIAAFAFAILGGASLVPAGHARADELPTARRGTLFCGGNYNGSGTNQVTWVLRNFDNRRAITVNRIRLYDSEGTNLFDSLLDGGLPASRHSHLGPTDNELLPHETAHYRSEELVPDIFPNVAQNRRPFQFIVNWSAASRGLALDGSMVRRRFELGVGETGRHQYDCRHGRR